jgi:uncharacterized protein YjbI with pentapeptide repeats
MVDDERSRRLRIHLDDDWLDEVVIVVLTVLFIGVFILSWLAHQGILPFLSTVNVWLDGLFQNSGTEFFGALLTFLLIEIMVGGRDRRREQQTVQGFLNEQEANFQEFLRKQQEQLDEQERRALVDQLSSRVPGFAAEAVRLLKHRGWYDEMDLFTALQNEGNFAMADLRGLRPPGNRLGLQMIEGVRLDLRGARLEKADLREAQLEGSTLSEAHLEGTDLSGAELKDTALIGASLEGAGLYLANLKEANLSEAHLEGSNLGLAQLEGADLRWAHLEGVKSLTVEQLEVVQTLEGCTLPDGTRVPEREKYGDPEPDWSGTLAVWVARGREEGWIYDSWQGKGFIDVEKIPGRGEEAAEDS